METQNAVLGISYCIVALVLFVLNGVVLKALTRHDEYKTNTYRIIKNMCVACMFQLLPFFVGGLMTLFNTLFHYYVDRVFGVLIASGWFFYLALSLTLAIDRLVIFTLPKTFAFSDKITNCLLLISWLFWIFNVVILSWPGFGYTYTGEDNFLDMWSNTNDEESLMMASVEAYFDLIILSIILLIYLIVCGYLVKMRLSSSIQLKSFIVEIKIFLIAVVSFSYETLLILYSFWVEPFSDDQRLVNICVNVAWMVDCGLFVIVTLIINQSLRRRVLELIGANINKSTAVTSLTARK